MNGLMLIMKSFEGIKIDVFWIFYFLLGDDVDLRFLLDIGR